jgi:hypothetical protein
MIVASFFKGLCGASVFRTRSQRVRRDQGPKPRSRSVDSPYSAQIFSGVKCEKRLYNTELSAYNGIVSVCRMLEEVGRHAALRQLRTENAGMQLPPGRREWRYAREGDPVLRRSSGAAGPVLGFAFRVAFFDGLALPAARREVPMRSSDRSKNNSPTKLEGRT